LSFSFPLGLTVLSVGVSTSLGFLSLQRCHSGEPRNEASCPFSPRFRSQVFSTSQRFPSRPELRGLVSCRNRSWDRPFRVFPSQRSRAPLEAALLPCRYPPPCVSEPPASLSPPVSPTPTLSRSCLDPHSGYRLPFREPKSASQSPRSRAAEPPRSASFTDFEALIPPRVRSCPHRVAPIWRPILSWVSPPPESSPTAPWVLDPPKPPGLEHDPSSEDSGPRQEGSLNPPCRVNPSEHVKRPKDFVDGFQPLCEAGPDHLSVVPLLPWP
jgi:hypothetical protein